MSHLRNRLRRLEQRSAPATVTIALLPATSTPEQDAAIYAAARELVGEHGTVLGLRLMQPDGPPTMRRPRPGEDGTIAPVAPSGPH